MSMDTMATVKRILRDTLNLGPRADVFESDTPLLGAIPEFDSMAVVSVLSMIEEEFDLTIPDDEVSAEVFRTVGSLAAFVGDKAGR
jgi:acyl carrier protein